MANPLILIKRAMTIGEQRRPNYLKITALEDNTDVSIVATGTPYPAMLQYSINEGPFIDYTIGNTINIDTDETIEWRRSPNDTDNKFCKNNSNYYDFNISKSVSTTGYITSLLKSDGLVTTIPNNAFNNCQNIIMELELPNTLVSTGSAAFKNCKKLYGNLVLPEGFRTNGTDGFQNCIGITGTITLPSTITNLGYRGFAEMTNFVGPLVIPEGVTAIQDRSFYKCSACKDITIPSTVTSIGQYSFSNSSNVTVKCLPTSVPSTNTSFSIMSGLKIYVPYSSDHSVFAAYQTAWSGFDIYELNPDNSIPT